MDRPTRLLELIDGVTRTGFDMDRMINVGYCPGVENYSRWFDGRNAGDPPYTLNASGERQFKLRCLVDVRR